MPATTTALSADFSGFKLATTVAQFHFLFCCFNKLYDYQRNFLCIHFLYCLLWESEPFIGYTMMMRPKKAKTAFHR